MNKAYFYHAGCPVCVAAEQMVADAIDKQSYEIEIIHLGEQASRITEAKNIGVKSVPALVLNNQVFHINFGAALSDLG
ncbi:thioredoxin family protein [Methylocucumis oryzae]|nr:thioredoxin family protein [Methylocucumis oryzae]